LPEIGLDGLFRWPDVNVLLRRQGSVDRWVVKAVGTIHSPTLQFIHQAILEVLVWWGHSLPRQAVYLRAEIVLWVVVTVCGGEGEG
jgi:hypothetical protein